MYARGRYSIFFFCSEKKGKEKEEDNNDKKRRWLALLAVEIRWALILHPPTLYTHTSCVYFFFFSWAVDLILFNFLFSSVTQSTISPHSSHSLKSLSLTHSRSHGRLTFLDDHFFFHSSNPPSPFFLVFGPISEDMNTCTRASFLSFLSFLL